jgi:amino acid transporter
VPLFQAMGAIIVLGSLGSGLSGEVAAARLLFAMGRDGVLPGRFFGYLDAARGIPTLNVLLIAILTLSGCLSLDLERAGELLNFGAFLSFMGVNLAAIRRQFFGSPAPRARRMLPDLIVPTAGFLFCLAMWVSLPKAAKIVGGVWLVIGLLYNGVRTRGFRSAPAPMDFAEL